MRAGRASAEEGQRFKILRQLGRGGFGEVHEAFDHASNQRVALKELARTSPSGLFRFKQEFRVLAGLHHPNLVRLHELIEQEGRWYIVMELIEGEHLSSFIRGGESDPSFNEARLRAAFIGIAEGVEALHAYGVLHRDLKPSNVIVRPEGRAVLLDFGLVTSLSTLGQSSHADAVGTVRYMAPEQADGQKLGRASDWYAFGASLYEALTGRLPFEGDAIRIALNKLRNTPPHPNALVAGLPPDLSDLCMRLLQIAPQSRPTGREVLQVLRGEVPHDSLPCPPLASPVAGEVFTGRDSEMDHLERALARTQKGELRIVLIEGESGVGKSELVSEFLRRQQRQTPETMALRGRCYENEQVSYKAFDGCIDELARRLRRMGKDAAALMPAHAPLLGQLFPVLSNVQPLMRARRDNIAADPTARRLQAFAALSALLSSLAEERPLIVVIDDLQWADGESFHLLRALVDSQTRPPILLIATVRPREELESDVLASLAKVRDWTCTDVVSLHGLLEAQAEALAQALLGPDRNPRWASTIAKESHGHPLFLVELIHFTQNREPGSSGALTVDAAVKARVEQLDANARALLEMVALAARPHSEQLFARALGLARVDESVRVLLGRKLLRTRREHEIGCYHDQIRHAAINLIPAAQLPSLHRRLAQALTETPMADPTEEAAHWDLSGDAEQALKAYERAAKQALEGLAFAQAERFLARALELAQGPQHPHYAALTSSRAHALACAGRSAEAALLYQRAAELAPNEEARLRLRSRTALQLMLSGNLQTGFEACQTLFAQVGVRIPKSDWAAVLVALWHRLWTRFPKVASLATRRDDPKTRLLLDLLDEHLDVLSIVKTSTVLAASAQYARLALRSGNREHLRLAYSFEGLLRSRTAGPEEAAPYFTAARQLARGEPGSVRLRAALALREGAAFAANWRLTEGCALLEEAERLYSTQCVDEPWPLLSARFHLGMIWYRIGEHAHLAQKMGEWIREGSERKDPLAVALLSGLGCGAVRHFMRGDAEAALVELDASVAHLTTAHFSEAHFGQLLMTQCALILRGGRAAWDWYEQRRKQHDSAFLLRCRMRKQDLIIMRSQAALCALQVATPSESDALVKAVQHNISTLERNGSPFARSFASLLAAQIAALRGSSESALHLVRKARLGFEGIGDATARIAGYLEGLLEGGENGRRRCADVLSFYEDQSWVHPQQAVLMHLPSLPVLADPRRTSRTDA